MIALVLLLACGSGKDGDTSTPTTATTATTGTPGTNTTTPPYTSNWTTTTTVTTPPGATTPGGTPGGTGTFTDTASWDECDWAQNVPGWLDTINTTPGRVLYCHSSSGTNFTFNDTDVSSCLTHVTHQYDIFPSWGC